MKNILQISAVLLTLTLGSVAQNQAASSTISTTTENGQTTIRFHDRTVWSGPTAGRVSGKTSNINGTEQAAAFEDGKLLWESAPGAARQLNDSQGSNNPGALNLSGTALGNANSKGPTLKTVNGESVLYYHGKEINLGKQSAPLSVQSKSINGKEHVVVKGGERIIWESGSGF